MKLLFCFSKEFFSLEFIRVQRAQRNAMLLIKLLCNYEFLNCVYSNKINIRHENLLAVNSNNKDS